MSTTSAGIPWYVWALMTVICWGTYGVCMHTGSASMKNPEHGRIMAFLWVGLAYFFTAVIAPIIILKLKGGPIDFWAYPAKGWQWSLIAGTLGAIGALAAFLIVAFYSVVAGWVLYYVSVMGMDLVQAIVEGDPLRGALAGESREQIQQRLGDMFANPLLLIVVHFLFMGLTFYIVARGVSSGIEKAATYLMPMFFVLLVGLVLYGAIEGDIGQAAAFLFTPDWSKLTPQVMNSALGQALFSLSLGVAGLITYGSYIKEGSGLGPTSALIAVADTCVALLAGLMIFPIVFAVGLDPAAGPTLVFQTLPFAFQTMPGGALFGFLFFVLILVAAVTSSISLLEVPTAWGIGERGWSRPKSALIFGGGAFLMGIACLLGYNVWADVRPLGFWSLFADTDIMDTVDGFTGKVMLPVGALLSILFFFLFRGIFS